MVGYPREFPLDDFFVEALHVISSEWWHERTHLVKNAAERPDITLAVIRLVAPHFGTRVVRGASLRVTEAFLDDFGDVKIAQFSLHVFKKEQVCTLHISVENAPHVKGSQASDNLNKDVPDLLLLDVGLSFLVVTDFLENITVVCIFHYQTEAGCRFINEGISISNDIRMVNRGQNTHFIQGVFFLFFGE